MTFKKRKASRLFFVTCSLVVFVLSACQMQARPDKTAMNPTTTHHSMNHSDNSRGVPKTGQTRKYMAADDGDLRIGKPWPAPRFAENGDGTVTDRLTGLMWTRNADKANGIKDWEQAISEAVTCTEGGFSDWRLPNRNELESLIDLGNYDPALPNGHPFTGVQSSYYWTSTTPANNEDHAWVIQFYIGLVTHDDKGGSHYVWYVRGGQ
jgi:hypothetical protein